MNRKYIAILLSTVMFLSLFTINSIAESNPGEIYQDTQSVVYKNVTVYAPAVATTEDGYVGVISTITVTIQNNGSGRVFVDTQPLTQVDMQGSARLAVKVASKLVSNDEECNINPDNYDYFFVVRTSSPIIGGPSAGGIMTVATISLLENWEMNNRTVMTGMINPDGSIGPIGGIPQKIDAAWSVGANRFLIPKGQSTYAQIIVDRSSWIPVQRTVTKNVDEYVQEKGYDINVNEVSDINDALRYYTGYNFSSDVSLDNISTETYVNSMKPLASSLLDSAQENYDISIDLFEESSIPNVGGFFSSDNYRNFVEGKINDGKKTLNDSEKWFEEKQYYTSTSKSFQSLIDSRFVKYACEYYDIESDNEKKSYIEDLIDQGTDLYDNASKKAKSSEINGYITLQSVGAAQKRVSEAKDILKAWKSAYENDNVRSFWDILALLENMSFAIERLNSVDWWIQIGNSFNDTQEISNEKIQNLALEYIEEAQQSYYYSTILLEEMSSSDINSVYYLRKSESLIESSQNDLDKGLAASALFEALEALVNAHLAIEIIGTTAEEKIDIASENANKNIAKLRKINVEPILAVSYYEFAEGLRNESAYSSAVTYYKYSGMIAGALGFTNLSCGTTSSRYVGIPEVSTNENSIFGKYSFVLYGLFLGFIAGIGIGFIITGVKSSSDQKKKKESRKPQHRKKELNIDPKNYPNKEIPRSIRDYYKKNK